MEFTLALCSLLKVKISAGEDMSDYALELVQEYLEVLTAFGWVGNNKLFFNAHTLSISDSLT